jgi:ABC-2 type transport system permease protein
VQDDQQVLDRVAAQSMVRQGASAMAIVLKRGSGQQVAVDLLADSSDQVASQMVSSFVTKSLMLVEAHRQVVGFDSPDSSASRSGELLADQGPTSSHARTIKQYAAKPAAADIDPTVTDMASSVSEGIQLVDVMGEGKSNPVISMYAAGIAVMFLLFGATGAGGALLEERESQTLERLLSTRMSMDQLLLGKWFYMTALGLLQVTVMFLWAHCVFDVDLLGHLDGFLMMTLVTALAASGFGLFLATLCKTRGQLNGLSVVLVLSMSALGGSMVPRYLMSENLQKFGLWTFNAWALDGYNKVFWRELPVSSLAPQLFVLMFSGLVFLLVARVLAVRWETQ